jgi:hypothetical protein
MSPRTATARGRRAMSNLTLDCAQVTRLGAPVFDPDTGLMTDTAEIVYSGPCRLMQTVRGSQEDARLFGEQSVTASRFIACFPYDVTGITIDDVVTIEETEDSDLLARRFRITAIPMGTFTIYKAFPCEVVE